MGLRDRRARRREERDTFGQGGSARRYRMRQKMLSIGNDFWIEDEQGERVFRVDGKVSKRWFRVRDTYGVEMAPDQNPALLLAVTVAIDEMAHPGN
jgi:uncharacterized protein YxjI